MGNKNQDALPGAGRCPRCGSRKVHRVMMPDHVRANFYAGELEACGNPACNAVWEPFKATDLLDEDRPRTSSFCEPCDNCAFRPGSPEQANPERWREMMAQLKGGGDPWDIYCRGGGFYCHKGVPLDPGGEHGFAYPMKKIELDGKAIETSDRSKLRPCRGWLRMLNALSDKERAEADDAI